MKMPTEQRGKRKSGEKILRGCRNQYPGCGAFFSTTRSFDHHRIGKFGSLDNPRRCADPSERGMSLGKDGYWRTAGGYWEARP